jgi:phosphoglucosamine mutase
MGKYFGTDGFRGEANKDLTVEHAYKVGRYIGWYFGRNKDHAQVVIGKDTRRSSYMLEYALVAGLTASGADVSLMHVTTTPSVAYITRTDGFDCGIMISASHNPYYDNGIKVLDCNGHKMDAKVENLIEQYIDGEVDEIPFATKDEIGFLEFESDLSKFDVDFDLVSGRYVIDAKSIMRPTLKRPILSSKLRNSG